MRPAEIDDIAAFISAGYDDDIFFEWVVPSAERRHSVVKSYYAKYLSAKGAFVYIAEENGTTVGAACWLPHDVDPTLYDKIDAATGEFAPNFRAVADASHANEPLAIAFTQLLGFVVDKMQRGRGIGTALLAAHLNEMDAKGEATYLEASTPFHGGGVYGKLGYKIYSDVMRFSPTAILWPLFREAGAL